MFEIDSARLPDLMPISGKLRGVAFPPSSPRRYDSHLTDEEWRLIKSLFPPPATTGRRQKHARREIVDAILCVVQPGRAWRFLPREFPPWQTVFWYFGRRRADGSLDILRKREGQRTFEVLPAAGWWSARCRGSAGADGWRAAGGRRQNVFEKRSWAGSGARTARVGVDEHQSSGRSSPTSPWPPSAGSRS